jgi:hypothetical protein
MISEERRDYYAGALMIVVGASAAFIGAKYQIGTLTKMGPGFFPTCLGVLLVFMGILIAIAAKTGGGGGSHGLVDAMHGVQTRPDWRGWSCIIGSVISFIVLADNVGLAAATFACVFIGASGDKESTVKGSALLALGITVFAIILFSYILRVQIPVIKGLW